MPPALQERLTIRQQKKDELNSRENAERVKERLQAAEERRKGRLEMVKQKAIDTRSIIFTLNLLNNGSLTESEQSITTEGGEGIATTPPSDILSANTSFAPSESNISPTCSVDSDQFRQLVSALRPSLWEPELRDASSQFVITLSSEEVEDLSFGIRQRAVENMISDSLKEFNGSEFVVNMSEFDGNIIIRPNYELESGDEESLGSRVMAAVVSNSKHLKNFKETEIVIREIKNDPTTSWRCFVFNREITAISKHYCGGDPVENQDTRLRILQFLLPLLSHLPTDSCVVDVLNPLGDNPCCVLDISPFHSTTDAYLYDWTVPFDFDILTSGFADFRVCPQPSEIRIDQTYES